MTTTNGTTGTSTSTPTMKVHPTNFTKHDKPWLSWPVELPRTNEHPEQGLQKQYHELNDPAFFNKITSEQRARLIDTLHSKHPTATAVLLAGGTSEDFDLYDTDVQKCEFRQESFFRYLFGINEPDCYGVIDLQSNQSILFIPFIPDSAERWNGERRELQWYTDRYAVDSTVLVDDIVKELAEKRGIKKLLTLQGLNYDSGSMTRTSPKFLGLDRFELDQTTLHPVLVEQRVIKTQNEVALLRIANEISSAAHVYVMRHIQPGMVEQQLEAMYKSWTSYYGGARHVAYTCICGSSNNGSILHYGHAGRPNDRTMEAGDLSVLDMGAEYIGYATDITRSYPVDGKFTDDHKIVYNAVLAAHQAVQYALKPGVNYSKMHVLAERIILEHLHAANIIHNGTIEEYQSVYLASAFMPHGLGHLVGLNVHDVGGLEDPAKRAQTPGLAYLRLDRDLKAGMLLTVEPGCYFNEPTLRKAMANPEQSKFINKDVLKRFIGTGGVRIEDDVLITEDGCENLTTAPVKIEDIEEIFRQRKQKS